MNLLNEERVEACAAAVGLTACTVTARARVLAGAVLSCTLLGVLALTPARASGYVRHADLGAITVAPKESNEVTALAVDPASGGGSSRLWVAEEHAGVFEFDAGTGAKLAEVSPLLAGDTNGVAVGHGSGGAQVYVTYSFTSPAEVGVYDGSCAEGKCPLLGRWNGSDTKAKTFGDRVGGVAVDNNPNVLADPGAGRVYVADGGEDVIDVFRPKPKGEEEFIEAIEGPEPGVPFAAPFHHWDIAVDQATGDVLVENTVEEGKRPVLDIFEPQALGYKLVGEVGGPPLSDRFGDGQLALGVGPDAEAITHGTESEALYGAEERTKNVDEFLWPGGGFVGRITGAAFGPEARFVADAVDPATHDLFVGVYDPVGRLPLVERFGEGVVLPSVTDGVAAPLSIEAGLVSEQLNGTVNPLEAETHETASCWFVWGLSPEALSNSAPCSKPVSGNTAEPVSVPLSGLKPDTTYFYRLQARNGKGTNPGEEEEDGNLTPPRSFTTPGPGLHGVSVAKVTADSATLEATINPHGAPSSYVFEYGAGPCPASCKAIPASPEALGRGEEDIEVSEHIQELTAETDYHYRLIVNSELKLAPTEPAHDVSFASTEGALVTQSLAGPSGLIDGRAWELVSPPAKNGALILSLKEQQAASIQASQGGGAFAYVTRTPTEVGGVQGYSSLNQVLAVRGTGGWRSCDLGTLQSVPEGASLDFPQVPSFSADLTHAAVQQETFDTTLLSEEASERTPYIASLTGCERKPTFAPVATAKEPFADVTSGKRFGGTETPLVQFVAASPDFKHVVTASTVQLTTTPTPPGQRELYEWSAERPPAERLQLIDGAVIEGADGRNAVSADGTRVFWSGGVHDTIANGGLGETLAFPGSEFQFATKDITGPARASTMFFTGEFGDPSLSECQLQEEVGHIHCTRTDITPPNAEVLPYVSVSEDGSYVYFVANAVLGDGAARGATPGGCTVEKQIPCAATATTNLYVYHDGTTHFIATLSGADEMDWGISPSVVRNRLGSMWATVSPNGRYYAFMSSRPLAGYDNRDVASGRPDEEIYEYDALTDRLVCASCDPTGARPVGVEDDGEGGRLIFTRSEFSGYSRRWYAATLPGWDEVETGAVALHQARYLSNDGRLFFNAEDALVPGDINGTVDVYEYEPAGGACSAAASRPSVVFKSERAFEVEGRAGVEGAGCVGLLSSGRSPQESVFMDANEGGSEAFFLTSERLTSLDKDGSPDIYVARECTVSSPCLSPPPEPLEPCSTAESCRSAPTPQPGVFGAPSSATFSGPGNLIAAPPSVAPGKPGLSMKAKLSRALRACRRDRSKRARAKCERAARARYARRSPSTATSRTKGKVGR